MGKVAWILIVVHYSPAPHDHIFWTETQYLSTKEQCERYERQQVAVLRAKGVKTDHLMTECIQVVPIEGGK